MVHRTINITGNTKNVAGHAALVAESAGVFLIDGMDKWKDELVDRKVKLIGDLEKRKRSKLKLIRSPVVQFL